MSDETKIFTKNDKNGDKCASGGQESGLKLIFERGVAILVRPWRFPGQPKKFVFFSIKVGTINSGTSLDSREQFKKTGKLEYTYPFSSFLVLESDALGQPAYPDVKDYSRRELEEIIKNISKPEVLHGGELEVAAENGPLSAGEPRHLHV